MTKHSHILFSHSFDDDGTSHEVDNAHTAEELKSEGLAWVHLDANNKTTKKWLEQEASYLDHLIIDALLAAETRPRVISFNDGLLIILRGVNSHQDCEPKDMPSIRIWIDKERIITVQRRNMKAVFDIEEAIKAGKKIKNSGEFLYNILYEILFTTSPFLYALTEEVDALEEKVTTTHDIKFREAVLRIRSKSSVFKRYLLPQKDVIAKLKASECSWINDWDKRHFQENYDNITHLIEEADEARERSQILHDELANALSEKLNRSMYKLSLITVIFMPLTFLTGLFGINVGGIPGSEYEYAFYIFATAMITIGVVQTYLIKKKDWF